MKKFLTLFTMLFVGLSAWATDITFTAADFTPVTEADYSTTKEGVTVAVVASTVTADQLRIFKDKTITISCSTGNISKIEFTCTAKGKTKYGPGGFTAPSGYTFEDDGEIGTWTGSASEVTFTAANSQVRTTQIVVTVSDGGGQTKTVTSVEFTGDYVTRFTPGKDGDETPLPTATVKAGLTTVAVGEIKWTFKMDANWVMGEEEPSIYDGKIYIPNHSSGELTLTASYAGDDTYEASSKSYTLKVYKGFMNIQSILEDFPVIGSDSWKAKEKEWNKGYQASYWQVDAKSETEFTSKEAIVTYASGQYTYIKDDYGPLLLYGNNLGFKKGDIISGDLGEGKGFGGIYGTLKTYNGLLELAVTKDDIEFVVKSSDNVVEPKTITIDELNQTNMNEFVKIENAVFVEANNKNLTFKVGETDLAVFNQWNIDVSALESGAEYTLEGMGSVYYKNETVTNQLYLISFVKKNAGVKTATSVEFPDGYMARFTPGKDGEEALLPTVTVKADDAAVEGATVAWTLEMGNNWVMGEEEPSIREGKVYIPNHSCGDLTLTANYAGNDTYEPSSNSYTLKVYKGYLNIQSILEDFPEIGSDTWKAKEAEWRKGYQASYWQVDMTEDGVIRGKEALVTYVNGSYTYIKDDFGSLLLYGSNLGFKQGDMVTSSTSYLTVYPPLLGPVYGTLKAYNGLLELAVNKEDVELIVASSDNPVEPKTITVDELNQTNMNEYLKIENAVFVGTSEDNDRNLIFKVGETEFIVYNQWKVNVTALTAGSTYNIEGMGSIFYKNETVTYQLYLVNFEFVDTTGINSTTTTLSEGKGDVYDLSGRRVNSSPKKGVVIMNGKKIVK